MPTVELNESTLDYLLASGKTIVRKAKYVAIEMKQDFTLPDGTPGKAKDHILVPGESPGHPFILTPAQYSDGYYTPKTRKPKEDKANVVDS